MVHGFDFVGKGWKRKGWKKFAMRRTMAPLYAILFVALFFANTGIAQAAERVHVVRQGEGLARIAQSYGISMSYLAQYNGITDLNHVLIGQQLRIPYDTASSLTAPPANSAYLPGTDGYYVVKQGDMLNRIARDNSMALEDLMRINGIQFADTIYVGQKLRLTARVQPTQPFVDLEPAPAGQIYVVQAGDSLALIAQRYGMTLNEVMTLNGLPNPNFVWTGQRLRVNSDNTPSAPIEPLPAAGAPANGVRLIEINLSTQTLTAWQGGVAIMNVLVSTGKASTPTVPGSFKVYNKVDSQRMTGPGYDLPGVPWVMYYYADYAIHGAYWHAAFGTPTSHGCTNMTLEDAEVLYNWASVGTDVYVHY